MDNQTAVWLDALMVYWRDNQTAQKTAVTTDNPMGVRRAVRMVVMKVERMEPQTAVQKAARMVDLTGDPMAASTARKMVDQMDD